MMAGFDGLYSCRGIPIDMGAPVNSDFTAVYLRAFVWSYCMVIFNDLKFPIFLFTRLGKQGVI